MPAFFFEDMERTKENLTLTPRLQAIADRVPQGARLADVGTDHGHLPLWLLTQERLSAAIASDVRQGPLDHARDNARLHGLSDRVRFVLAAGLDGVGPADCDTISIAGMGGETIAGILQAAPWTAQGAHCLLLQPMTMLAQLRQWLWAHGYAIESECICREGRRFYLVWQVRGGAPVLERPLPACVCSEALLRADGAADYLRALLERERHALLGMERGAVDRARVQAQRETVHIIEQALKQLEGLECRP